MRDNLGKTYQIFNGEVLFFARGRLQGRTRLDLIIERPQGCACTHYGRRMSLGSQSARPKLLIHLPTQAYHNFRKRLDVLQRSAEIHDAETQREFAF